MGKIRRIFSYFTPKKKFYGGKRTFKADRIELSEKPKFVQTPSGKELASGAHGMAFELAVYKGEHKTGLVIKKYHVPQGPNIARREFNAFVQLKAKGYPVPPTIRLVKIGGREYVALTNLSKFGDVQTKNLAQVKEALGARTTEEIQQYLKAQAAKAAAEEKIDLSDSWEFIINTRKKTVRAFILDLAGHLRVMPREY